MFEAWPFTNFHDLNLDWLISKWKKLEDNLDDIHESMDAAAASADVAAEKEHDAKNHAAEAMAYKDLARGYAEDAEESADSISDVVYRVNANSARIDNLIANAGDGTIPSELVDIRVGWNGIVYTTAGDAVRTQVSELNREINESLGPETVTTLTPYNQHDGAISSAGNWVNLNANNQHIVVPVEAAGAVLKLTANSTQALYFAGVRSYSTPVNGQALDMSTATGWTGRQTLAANISITLNVPQDVQFIVFVVLYNGNDATPASIELKYPDTALMTKIKKSVTPEDVLDGFNLNPEEWGSGTYTSNPGTTSTYNANPDRRFSPIFKFDYDVDITSDGDFAYMIITLDDNDIVLDLTAYITETRRIFKNTRFRLILQDATDSTIDISGISDADVNDSVKIRNNDVKNTVYYGGINWACMGDSISEGVRSYIQNGVTGTITDRINGWAYLVRNRNNWKLNNLSIGGSGYLCKAAASSAHPNPDETPAWYIARNTDFTPYNLVTLSYGINDWKGNYTMGSIDDDPTVLTPSTVIQAMKATIEAIMASNPLCKIIVTTPLNCAGYNFDYGNQSTNYGLGYTMSNTGTLDSFTEKMKEVCDYYGIQYIDMSHYSCINRQNLLTCLPDGVHPSLETHDILAHEYGRKLTF